MKKYIGIGKQIIFGYVFLLLNFIAGPILIFILTHTLSTEEFGVYSLFAGLILVFGTFLELGISQFISTILVRVNQIERSKYFLKLLMFIFPFFIILGLVLIFSGFSGFFLSKFNLLGYSKLWTYVILLILAHSLLRFFSSFFIASKRLNIASLSSFMFSSSWVSVLFIFFILNKEISLIHVLISWLSLSTLMIFIYLINYLIPFFNGIIGRLDFSKFSKYSIKKALIFGLPTVPALAGFWIISIGDRYMLAFFNSKELVGIYAFIYTLIGISYSISVVIPTILFPYLSEAFTKNKHIVFLNIVFKYSLALLIPALTGLYILRKELILIFAGNNYLEGLSLFPYLILYPLIAFMVFILFQNMLIRKETKKISLVYILGAIMNILLNILFIPSFGMKGAAIATMITYMLMFIWMFFYVGKLEISFKFIKLDRIFISTVIMVSFIVFVPNIEFKGLWSIVIKICLAGVIYVSSLFLLGIMERKEKDILKKIMNIGR